MVKRRLGPVKVSVFRCVGEPREKGHYDEFEVPFVGGMNVLGVLEHIYGELDPSLSYYKSCRIGRCSGCFVNVNGKTVMACDEPAVDQDMVIEPLRKFKLIKDLVVDFSQLADLSQRTRPETVDVEAIA
jgi:succinate dehydrogenase/fumarate reductase iron-sulfur protein